VETGSPYFKPSPHVVHRHRSLLFRPRASRPGAAGFLNLNDARDRPEMQGEPSRLETFRQEVAPADRSLTLLGG
jgi:hypothetical protein